MTDKEFEIEKRKVLEDIWNLLKGNSDILDDLLMNLGGMDDWFAGFISSGVFENLKPDLKSRAAKMYSDSKWLLGEVRDHALKIDDIILEHDSYKIKAS